MVVSTDNDSPLTQNLPSYIDLVLDFSTVLDPRYTPKVDDIIFTSAQIEIDSMLLNTTCLWDELSQNGSSCTGGDG